MTTYNQLQAALQERALIEDKIQGLKTALAQEVNPYKKGDIVKVLGYSHTGKDCRIVEVRITIDGSDNKIGFLVSAIVLRKDGSDSQSHVRWTEWHDQKLKDALNALAAAPPPINFS